MKGVEQVLQRTSTQLPATSIALGHWKRRTIKPTTKIDHLLSGVIRHWNTADRIGGRSVAPPSLGVDARDIHEAATKGQAG
jgi:hypothetical protein